MKVRVEKFFINECKKKYKNFKNFTDKKKLGYDFTVGKRKVELKVRKADSLDEKPKSLELTETQLNNMEDDDFWIFYILYKNKRHYQIFEYKATFHKSIQNRPV